VMTEFKEFQTVVCAWSPTVHSGKENKSCLALQIPWYRTEWMDGSMTRELTALRCLFIAFFCSALVVSFDHDLAVWPT